MQLIFDSIDVLLVHPVDRSIVVTSDKQRIEVKGKVVKDPKILTGGGNNLNAGFCFGFLNDFTVEECMVLGMAASGAYVQNGFSPGVADVIDFLELY